MGGAGRRGELPRQTDGPAESSDEDPLDQLPFTKTPILDEETWFDYWSEELAIAYHVLIDQCQSNGYAFLEHSSFPNFVEFVYKHSSKRPPDC